ncbi:MAG: discoidin domain-containing protein [Armatimonadetes bacterium]|nr:discoidin domain-containing protein [Armatimonadota bacterium]
MRESAAFHYFLVLISTTAMGIGQSVPCLAEAGPKIEDYATIEAYVRGLPVYSFGYTSVYSVSPDLLRGMVMQEGNTHPVVKFTPRKSWEIQDNLCGSTPAREPKTMWNDDQPLLPVHLIDGDPETAWSSRGGTAADRQPEWIRIDLPAEATVASVALVCSQAGPGMGTGKVLPKDLTVKLSRDARVWEAVYENTNFSGPNAGPSVISFQPRTAKHIWIVANNLQPVGNWGHAFSIGEVEVRDPGGENLALLAYGAGVQVSSTYYGYGMDRFTQDMLWPIQYDLGFKWTRVGYDMGMYLWSYVEREKGKLQIDPKADAAITEAYTNGVNVILCLDKGNWLYHNPPRKVDWKLARTREMMETYYDHQGWPTDSPELLEGYLRYVDYMVRHFKGRVAYYEICNEWTGIGIDNYVRLVKATIPVIKTADPEAKIMLGSVGGFNTASILSCLGKDPLVGVQDGKFVAPHDTKVVVQDISAKDVRVTVDALSNAEAGIIVRYMDSGNFFLAIYANGGIYFHEVVGGNYGPFLNFVSATGLGADIHLEAAVSGQNASFTISDGIKTFTTTRTIQNVNDPGTVGMFHNYSPSQLFDNFRVYDLQGNLMFEDQFSGPNGPAPGWTLVSPSSWGIEPGLGAQLDAIGWHPFYQTDPDSSAYRNYRQSVAQFKAECAALGFNGKYAATEWTWAAPYPGNGWVTEMTKAKYSAQLMTAHSGMDIISLYNETFQTGRIDWDCNLLRNAFSVDPISSTQPQPVYYVLRSISSVLDGFRAADFPVAFSGDRQFDCYTFRNGDSEIMVTAWIPGKTVDGIVQSRSDVSLPGVQASRAWVFDIFNGTQQELDLIPSGNDTIIPGMQIKDYPVFIRVALDSAVEPPFAQALGEARAAGPGWVGVLTGIVTAVFSDYNTFAVESEDRSCAALLAPMPDGGLQVGDEVIFQAAVRHDGALQMVGDPARTGRTMNLAPLGVPNRSLSSAPGTGEPQNEALLVTVWGQVLDNPTLASDGSTRFHITDGTAIAGGPMVTVRGAGSLLLNEDFSGVANGQNAPNWDALTGTWYVMDGRYMCPSGVNWLWAVAKGYNLGDCIVSAQMLANNAGVFARLQNPIPGAQPTQFVLLHIDGAGIHGYRDAWSNFVNAPWSDGQYHYGKWANVVLQMLGESFLADANIIGTNTTASLGPVILPGIYSSGSVGLYGFAGAGDIYDNVRVIDPRYAADSTAPADAVQVVAPPSVPVSVSRGDFIKAVGIAGKGLTTSGAIRGIWIRTSDDLSNT